MTPIHPRETIAQALDSLQPAWTQPWDERHPTKQRPDRKGLRSRLRMLETALQLLQDNVPMHAEVEVTQKTHMEKMQELLAETRTTAQLLASRDETVEDIKERVDVPAYRLVVVASDRIVIVQGRIDDSWPLGTTVPRSEIDGIEVHRTSLDPGFEGGVPLSETASFTVHYRKLALRFPLEKENQSAGRRAADLLPSFIDDRIGRPSTVL